MNWAMDAINLVPTTYPHYFIKEHKCFRYMMLSYVLIFFVRYQAHIIPHSLHRMLFWHS